MTARALELERRELAERTDADRATFNELTRSCMAAWNAGDPAAYAAAFTALVESPASEPVVGVGWPQYHHAKRADPGEDARQGVHEGAGLPRLCFPGALEFVLEHPDLAGVRLVHGYVSEFGKPWRHGWAELDQGTVLDPTTMRFYVKESFYQVMRAEPIAVYTPAEALASAERTGHCGPWEAFAEASVRLAERWVAGLRERCPELLAWVERMRTADQGFAACYERLLGIDPWGVVVVHLLHHLERNPAWWRHHRPGQPWPHAPQALGPFDEYWC